MKKIFVLVALFVLFMVGFMYKKPAASYVSNIFYRSQCDTPKTFKIGTIDSKYNITPKQFIENIDQASDLWSSYYGKKLFQYDPDGDIEVNLVYDQRQFLSTQINDLNTRVKSRQSELDPRISDYKKRSAEFRSKASQLNSDIEYWNNKGGAPPEEYEKLKSRQESLRAEAESLQQEASSLNQSAEEYNRQVGELQDTVSNFNEQLSFKPEEGEYIYDNGKQTINIYFDSSESQLIHTLAHELGHALEISHNNNQQSIMYPQSTSSVTLTQEDISSLLKVCEKKNIIEPFIARLRLIITSFRAGSVQQ